MRTILFHCKEYKTKITRLSNRPFSIMPEKLEDDAKSCADCIVILLTIEKNDESSKILPRLIEEVEVMSREVKRNKVVILPFAHISNNLAPAEESIEFINQLENLLKKDFIVTRDHFGSHKELLLSLYGHPGNARYREFY
jgi:threonyl-tRNA synthetase